MNRKMATRIKMHGNFGDLTQAKLLMMRSKVFIKGIIMLAKILVLSKVISLQVFADTINAQQLAYSFASQSISQKQETRIDAYQEMKEIFSEFHLRGKIDSKKFEQLIQKNEAFRNRLFEVALKYNIKALKKAVVLGPDPINETSDPNRRSELGR